MKYFVYCTTNLKTWQHYIGVHAQDNPYEFDGYLGSGTWRGKKKYPGKESLNQAIKKYGKENFVRSVMFVFDNEEDAYKKESEIVNEDFIGRIWNYNLQVGGKGGWARITKMLKEDPELRQRTNEKMSKSAKGKRKSEEHKRKISLVQKGINHHPDGNPMLGRNHSDKSKKLISEAMLGKSFCKWVTNGETNLYILKEAVIPLGYRLGRTMRRNYEGRFE
ncbi:MAG: NUMOD3 domain-containing DNA-binding protein [Rhabdochlamydiaceae bacterium]